MTSPGPQFDGAAGHDRWTPRNPLGVIALFVFLIETIATVSLKTSVDKPYALILVWFIVVYPVLIASAFFYILWHRRAALFGPMDYADPAEFTRILQSELLPLKKEVIRVAAKQEIADVDRTTPSEDVLRTVDRLLEADDPWSAIEAARKLLEGGDYERSLQILEHIRKRVGDAHPSHSRTLANIAYNQIGLGQYESAIENLLAVKNTKQPRNFGPWHALALAYAYFKTHNEHEYRRWLDEARHLQLSTADVDSIAPLYPEIADEIRSLLKS